MWRVPKALWTLTHVTRGPKPSGPQPWPHFCSKTFQSSMETIIWLCRILLGECPRRGTKLVSHGCAEKTRWTRAPRVTRSSNGSRRTFKKYPMGARPQGKTWPKAVKNTAFFTFFDIFDFVEICSKRAENWFILYSLACSLRKCTRNLILS